MSDQTTSGLLYLLVSGREHELVLRISGPAPTQDELATWMREGTVTALHVSPQRDAEAFTYLVNFGHVVAARLAPYSDSHTASF